MANPKKGEKIYIGNSISSGWIKGLKKDITEKKHHIIKIGGIKLKYITGLNSLWILYSFKNSGHTAVRVCFDPAGFEKIELKYHGKNECEFILSSYSGRYSVKIFKLGENQLFRIITEISVKEKYRMQYAPVNIYPLDNNFDPEKSEGRLHTLQHGPCTGVLYFSINKPNAGSVFYLQDFTSLNKYFKQTGTVPNDSVGGKWPELGMKLPVNDDCFISGKTVISDEYIIFSEHIPADEMESARLFLDMLAEIYLYLPKPETEYYDWIKAAGTAVKTLEHSKECYRSINNRYYLNAYVSSDNKPPESMVQLALLVPLMEYSEWREMNIKLVEKIKHSLQYFYLKDLKTITRWLPGTEFKNEERSEEEHHDKMDSWYHLHILLNLGRLITKGDHSYDEMYFNSVEYAIKTAKKFKYQWPVFYNMRNFKILKKETKEGFGGELDVPGIYAHVMLQAYEFNKDMKYLKEAEEAAKHIKGLSLMLVYQTNITLFNAIAFARLWLHTGNKKYLDSAILCSANIINRMLIWNSENGYAENYDTFMGLLPLHDAKYTAAYEESESMAAMYKLLTLLRNNAPESLHILFSEYMKYILHRGKFYYPQLLAEDAIAEKPREGTLNKKLHIPLEDLYIGNEKNGQVGQEVYGAAAPLIFVTCAYFNPDKLPFYMYCNYPVFDLKYDESKKRGKVTFSTSGSERLKCALKLIAKGRRKFRNIMVRYKTEITNSYTTIKEKDGLFKIAGNSNIEIEWEMSGK